jgi:hypothetical protein
VLTIVPLLLDGGTWWTEAHAAWVEAFALILIFGLDLILGFSELQERKASREERKAQMEEREAQREEREEQRKAREDERRERDELRLERQTLDDARQRNEVTCVGLKIHARTVFGEQLCSSLSRSYTNGKAGFALEKHLFPQFPKYLAKEAGSFFYRHRQSDYTGAN